MADDFLLYDKPPKTYSLYPSTFIAVYFICISHLYLILCFIIINLTCGLVAHEMDYQSNIYYRHPFAPNPCSRDMQGYILRFLRDVIFRLTSGLLNSMDRFVSYANPTLDILANTSLEEKVLRYWEALCSDAKFLIYQMKSLNIICSRTSLENLEE